MSRRTIVLIIVSLFFLILALLSVFSTTNISYTIQFFVLAILFGIIPIRELVQSKGLTLLPEQTVRASVVGKNIHEKHHTDENGSTTSTETLYNITFLTEQKNSWSFNLSLELYNSVLPGDRGELVYKVDKKQRVHYQRFMRTN